MRCPVYHLFLLFITIICTSFGNVDVDFFSSPDTCTQNSDCETIHPYALCVGYDHHVTRDPSVTSDLEDGLLPVTVFGEMNETNVMNSTNDIDGSGEGEVTSALPGGNDTDVTTQLMEMRRCRCDSDLGYHKHGNGCVRHIPVGDECFRDARTLCVDAHAHCVSDGMNAGTFRCLCKEGYVKVDYDGKKVCARKLTAAIDTSCYDCTQNEGICYDVTDDSLHDACLCPSTRSGDDCEVQHVAVHCDVDQFQMVVCYDHHPHIDLSQDIGLSVTGRDHDEMCKGHEITPSDIDCPNWDSKLVLDLRMPKRKRCGTKDNTRIPNKRRFENSITAAAKGPMIDASNSVTFTVFCQFTTSTETSFNGFDVRAVPGNDRGQHKKPNLNLQVETRLGTTIPEGLALRIGDQIRFKIDLFDDGTYSALRVEQCIASSSPVIPDPKAVVFPLTINSCPANNQRVLTIENSWQALGGAPNIVQTGLVGVFKMSKGASVFLHCRVKLCLKGSEFDCGPVRCNTSNNSSSRHRRSSDTTTSVFRELRWYEDEAAQEPQRQVSAARGSAVTGSVVAMGAADFGMMLTLLLVLLCIFMVSSGLLLFRLRRGNFTNPPEEDGPKPQRFALPRLNRNTFRI